MKKLMKKETKEQTTSGGAGAFDVPLFGEFTKKELSEMIASDNIIYDAPFGSGKKNPLKIDGVKSIKKSRAVKDKNFPKLGGEGSVYVKINDKCKKFPYCNQGDPKNLEMFENIDEVVRTISQERGIPIKIINEIILNKIS